MAELKLTQQAYETFAVHIAQANAAFTPHIEIYVQYTSNNKWNFKLPVKYTTSQHAQPCIPFWELRKHAGNRIKVVEFVGELEVANKNYSDVIFNAQRQYQAATLSDLAEQIKHDGFVISVMKGMQPLDQPRFESNDVKSIKVLL